MLQAVGETGDLRLEARLANRRVIRGEQRLDLTLQDGRGPVSGASVRVRIRNGDISARMRAPATDAAGRSQKVWQVYPTQGLFHVTVLAETRDGRRVQTRLSFLGTPFPLTPTPEVLRL